MLKQRKKVLLVISGTVVLLLGLMSAVVLAQSATPEAQTPESGATTEGTMPFSGLGRGFLGGMLGHHGGFGRSGDGDRDENLAEALGITVDELAAARQRAFETSVAEAVAAGDITQEQADELLAMHALKAYIDREALLAEALGMTVDELEAALDSGQSLSDLMTEKGIDAATLQTNMQAAYEAAIGRAVTDGVITQAQADELLSAQTGFGLFGGDGHGGRGHGGQGRGGHHGWNGAPDLDDTPTTPDSDTSETALDA